MLVKSGSGGFFHARLENLIPKRANLIPNGASYWQLSRPRCRDGRSRVAGGVSPLPAADQQEGEDVPPPRPAATKLRKKNVLSFFQTEIIPAVIALAFVKK